MEMDKPKAAKSLPLHHLIWRSNSISDEILQHSWPGLGSPSNPFLVSWIEHDGQNPRNFSRSRRWGITGIYAISTLSVSFSSSVYSGGIPSIVQDFRVSEEVALLGVSLFVLGFAVGPLFWAPLSETFGRRTMFVMTFGVFTAFNIGSAFARNITQLLVLRFLAGSFGSSSMTNSGGVVADLFPTEIRGLAMSIYSCAPFLGPVLGPIAGGFLGEKSGWRWIEGMMAIFTAFMWVAGCLFVPETYGPVILRRRAEALSVHTGKVFLSQLDHLKPLQSLAARVRVAISRPWVMLVSEPIVTILAIYNSIIYGTTYMMFAAYPIVFQQGRGWSPGVGGLAFIGVAIGMAAANLSMIWINRKYITDSQNSPGHSLQPEIRLIPCFAGSIAIPVGLFWFAWTNSASIPWEVCVAATILFGFGNVSVSIGLTNYLVDIYSIYAASALAATTVLRSLFGAAFPLFTPGMYSGLGIHWASSIPAFLALACAPFPFILSRYGPWIRQRCKFSSDARKADEAMRGL